MAAGTIKRRMNLFASSSSPLSRYMAAVVDSNTSARMLDRSRPPECISPWLSFKKLPTSRLLENPHRDFSQTSAARVFVSCPSDRWPIFSKRYSAVTKPSTESPRNSSRS